MIDAIAISLALHVAHGERPTQQPSNREASAAHSPSAGDMRGQMSSLYRGRYFHTAQEAFRMCVGRREGEWHYDVQGGGGNSYYGTYQFSWRFQRGIPYMMAKESRRTKDGLLKESLALRWRPINHWNRYWQDRAFYTVLNYNGIGAGRHHWNGGRWAC